MKEIKVTSPNKISTGIEGLDKILEGGLPQNRLFLLEGDPGTGKTTIALQFLFAGLRQDERCLYITLSESAEELVSGAASRGWSLDGITICDLTVSGDSLQNDSHYTVFHPSEVELDETTQAILTEIERVNPQRVVFDSLSEMRMLARDSLRFRRQILALKQYFLGKKCTVLMLDDRTTETTDRQLESIAHGVISLKFAPPLYGAQRHSLQVIKMRGVRFQSGSHDFNIQTSGIKVFPRLASKTDAPQISAGSLTSGSEDIESLIGSLDYGTSTILIGPAGVGKSTMAMMYAFNAAEEGKRSAVYFFDESLQTLYARTSAIGLDIRKHVENGLIIVRQVNLAELTPGEFSYLVSEEVEKNDVRVVIIDSVNGYMMATPQEKFLTMQFHELLSYLNRNGIVSLLIVSQYGLIGNMQSPIDMSYLADTVMLLRYFEAGGAVRQAISVLKKRTGKHERTIREFRIDHGGIVLGQPLKEFHGVLTGVPAFSGSNFDLMEKNGDDK
ncbi:MAG: AAA family ATPase [Pyrinomonadaceae bacterium]|nr:AAA family ATPase [Pyrinomonadaceae bacterium]